MADVFSTKVLLQNIRFSYAHLFVPTAMRPGLPEKYSLCVLIPKEGKGAAENKNAIDAVVAHLCEGVKADKKNKGKLPRDFDICVRDGDDDGVVDDKGDAYAGHWYVNAKSDAKPSVVGTQKDENGKYKSLGADEVKSGDYGHVTINFFAYDTAGNTGIGAGLNNVMKTRDGESLAGRASADSDFAEVDVDSSDDDDFM